MTPASWVALGTELGATFSNSARLIGMERENGMDDIVCLKVAIKAADLPAFLATAPVAPESFRPGTEGFLFTNHDWWDPDSALPLRTGQAHMSGDRALNIGVDDGRLGVVYLYIVNHGT